MRVLAFVLLALPLPSHAHSVTFEVWRNADPDDALFCALRLQNGQFTVVEVQGFGAPPAAPLRWYATPAEMTAMTDALQALVSGDIPSIDPTGSRLPPPPFVTVNWIASLADGIDTGLYISPGLALPDRLTTMLVQITPGGLCTRTLVK